MPSGVYKRTKKSLKLLKKARKNSWLYNYYKALDKYNWVKREKVLAITKGKI